MIETERLVLRHWQAPDLPELRRQSFDAEGMRYLLPLADEAAFQDMLARLDLWRDTLGFSFWAIERRTDRAILGLCGFKRGAEGTPIASRLEIGWRLGVAHWGHGYAVEAATACLGWADAMLPDDSVFAITVPANRASWGLMERLGMHRLPDQDFDHPLVADDSSLKRHITYRRDRPFVNHLR